MIDFQIMVFVSALFAGTFFSVRFVTRFLHRKRKVEVMSELLCGPCKASVLRKSLRSSIAGDEFYEILMEMVDEGLILMDDSEDEAMFSLPKRSK